MKRGTVTTTSQFLPGKRTRTALRVILVQAAFAAYAGPAFGQDWMEFADQSCRIEALSALINDAPCDPTCDCSPDPTVCSDTCRCACACEKDIADAIDVGIYG